MPNNRDVSLSIGQLAAQSGISAGTLRHYHALGLLTPSATTAVGYRKYNHRDQARLDLIRALRALDIDLETISRLLKGAVTVRRVAELHVQTLELQSRAITRRLAVLRALLKSETPPTAERLARLQVLASFERREREAFFSARVKERISTVRNADASHWMNTVASFQLPDAASEAQIEAWLELAEMISDETFLARYRDSASQSVVAGAVEGGATNPPTSPPTSAQPSASTSNVFAHYVAAARAANNGVTPESRDARKIVKAWITTLANKQQRRDLRAFAMQMLSAVEAPGDPREARFWQLLTILKPELARSPMSVGWPWLMRALKEFVK